MFFELSRLFQNNTKWLEKQQSTILSAAFIITIANAFSALAGLIKERFLVSVYFDTVASQQAYEAFQLAFRIPDILFKLIVVGAVSSAFIPIFTKYKKRDEQEAYMMANSVMNVLILIFVIASIVVFIFAEPLTMGRTGKEFSSEQIIIATKLTRIMLLSSFFFAISNFLTGILQSYQRFIASAIAPIFYNLGILLGVFLFAHNLGIYAAGVGVIIGAALHMLIQLPFVLKLGFRFQFVFNTSHEGVRRLFRLIPPRLVTLGITELQYLSLEYLTTSIGNLSLIMMNLSLRILYIPIRIFGVPISQASLPFLSEESTESDLERFKTLVLQSLNQISFFALPASVLILILRLPIVRLVYGAKNFPWDATLTMSKIIGIIAISIFAQAMVHLLIRSFYALKDTRTPLWIALFNLFLYIAISWVAIFVFNSNVFALALATMITAFTEVLLFMILLEIKVRHLFFEKSFLMAQSKMMIASFLMAVFLYLPYKILGEIIFDTSRTVELVALTISTSTIGVLVYLYFSVIFEVKELSYLSQLITKFGRWRQPLVDSKEVLIKTEGESGDEI